VPRFFFNVYDCVSSPDDTGTELPDWQEARLEAIRLAGAIFKDEAQKVALGEAWHMDVADEQGLVLFRLDFVSHDAPAVSRIDDKLRFLGI
jgi:hypothetical protein